MNSIHAIVILPLITVGSMEIPEYIQVCKRHDPNIDSCIKDSVEHLRPYLIQGVPEYHLPSLEPLLLKEIVVAEGTGGIRLTARDVHAYGASDFIVLKIESSMEDLHFDVDIMLPHLFIDGRYEIDGRVLLLPITGSGRVIGNFTNCAGFVKFDAEIKKTPDGEEHILLKEFKLKVTIKRGHLNLDNLFGGDKVIGDVVNNAISNNFEGFLKELMPLVEKALADRFLEIGNNIVEQFSYDQLFPVE